jgi:hypothetical protein
MLAKYRLMKQGVDVSPDDPLNPQFKFAVTDITEFGHAKMEWRNLNWNCAETEVVKCLEAFSRPLFGPESVLARQLADLATIHHPEDAAKEAQDLASELQARGSVAHEPDWLYFLCNTGDAMVPLAERTWTPLRRQPNDFKMMKRLSREQGRWAIIIRVSRFSPLLPHDAGVCVSTLTKPRRHDRSLGSCGTTTFASRSTTCRCVRSGTGRRATRRRFGRHRRARRRRRRTSMKARCLPWSLRGNTAPPCSAARTRSRPPLSRVLWGFRC